MPRFSFLIITIVIALGCIGCSGTKGNSALHEDTNATSKELRSYPIAAKLDTAKWYVLAIGEFLAQVKTTYNISYDTLYFGRHQFGQEDDFPDIKLPDEIDGTHIKVIPPVIGEILQTKHPETHYINLIATIDQRKSQFTFVDFSNHFAHQFDCTLEFEVDENAQEVVLKNTIITPYAIGR